MQWWPCTLLSFFTFIHLASLQADSEVTVGFGYRQDTVKWSVSTKSLPIPRHADIEWKKVPMIFAEIKGSAYICNQIRVFGNIDGGVIGDGEFFNRSFLNTTKTIDLEAVADGNNVWDASGGIGYDFHVLPKCTLILTPLAGYSFHGQNLCMTQPTQTVITNPAVPPGPLHHFRARYDSIWYGPWVGGGVALWPINPLSIWVEFEYHLAASFNACGKWDFRPFFFEDFRHHGSGHGYVAKCGIDFTPACWYYCAIGVEAILQDWQLKNGKQNIRTYVNTLGPSGDFLGGVNAIDLDKVHWCSWSVMATATFYF